MSEPRSTSSEKITRSRTDQGLHGDKIAASDPAAAPMETDAEASASRPLRDQRAAGAGLGQPLHFGSQPQPRPRLVERDWLLAGGVVVLVLAGIVAGMISVTGL